MGGTIGGLAAGQGGWEAIGSGLQSASVGAVVGGVLGAAAPLIARAGQALRGIRHRHFYHGTSREGAAGIRRSGIDLGRSRTKLDFGKGFYTTTNKAQAVRWADRRGGEVLIFRAAKSALRRLSVKTFSQASPEWAAFVRAQRVSGATMHGYDVVSGPMPKGPGFGAFLRGGALPQLGQQTSWHTLPAIESLELLSSASVTPVATPSGIAGYLSGAGAATWGEW